MKTDIEEYTEMGLNAVSFAMDMIETLGGYEEPEDPDFIDEENAIEAVEKVISYLEDDEWCIKNEVFDGSEEQSEFKREAIEYLESLV